LIRALQYANVAGPLAGVTISGFVNVYSAMWVSHGATATLVGCVFSDNIITKDIDESGVLRVNAAHQTEQDTVVHMKQCTFKDNSADHLIMACQQGAYPSESVIDYSPRICKDDPDLEVFYGDLECIREHVPWLLDERCDRQGISRSSEWLQMVQKVRSPYVQNI
jgi:hypothetical protein